METLLTPLTLWKDFDSSLPVNEDVTEEYTHDGVLYKSVNFSGRQTENGRVCLGGVLASKDKTDSPVILYLQDKLDKDINYEVSNHFVNLGFRVFIFNYLSFPWQKAITTYTEDSILGDINVSGDSLYNIIGDVKKTAWYEWICSAKYALTYLKTLSNEKIGVLGEGTGSILSLLLNGCDNRVDAVASINGFGWLTLKGVDKYAEESTAEVDMDDKTLAFTSGMETQSYVPLAKAPNLIIASSHNVEQDSDRAHDTVLRFNKDVPTYFNLSLGYNDLIGEESLNDLDLFFQKYLQDKDFYASKITDVTLQKDDYTLTIKVGLPVEKVKSVDVYVAECNENRIKRNFLKAQSVGEDDKGKRIFKFDSFSSSIPLMAFAKVTFESGFTVSSRYYVLEGESGKAKDKKPCKVLYDSLMGINGFFTISSTSKTVKGRGEPKTALGPFNIEGMLCDKGIKTYKVGSSHFRAEDNSLLLFSVNSSEFLKLKITADANKMEKYVCELSINAGKVWQSISLEAKNFKRKDGMPLSSFKDIYCLRMEGSVSFILSNISWV